MADKRNELRRTGVPPVTWPLQPGLRTPAPAEGAPGDPAHTTPKPAPRACCSLWGRPAARVREDLELALVQGQESGPRPLDFSRKGGVGRCVRIASSARARTPPQRKETDPSGASTHVAPAPPAPSSLPTPTPSPYLPKCPTLSKISSKLLDPMVLPCTTPPPHSVNRMTIGTCQALSPSPVWSQATSVTCLVGSHPFFGLQCLFL